MGFTYEQKAGDKDVGGAVDFLLDDMQERIWLAREDKNVFSKSSRGLFVSLKDDSSRE